MTHLQGRLFSTGVGRKGFPHQVITFDRFTKLDAQVMDTVLSSKIVYRTWAEIVEIDQEDESPPDAVLGCKDA